MALPYAKIILDRLATELKPRGFRRKGQSFFRAVNDCYQLVNLQASQFGSATSQRYTINLAVYSTLLEPLTKEATKLMSYEGHWTARIGQLTVDARDVWWNVSREEQAARAATEMAALMPIVLAAMNTASSYEALLSIPRGRGASYDDPPGHTFKWAAIAEAQRREGLPITEANSLEYPAKWRSSWHRRYYPDSEEPEYPLKSLVLNLEETLNAYVGPRED